MFSLSKIRDKAVGLVGFTSTLVDADLKASRSGLTFEGGSALVNVNTIKSLIDSDEDLNEYLKELVKGSFVEVLNSIFTKDDFEESGLLYPYDCTWESRNDIHGFIGYEIDTQKNSLLSLIVNKLIFGVGGTIYFEPQTNSNIGTVKVYLYNSQSKVPVASEEIQVIENEVSDVDISWILNNVTYGGKWYIGYFTSDLPSQPVAVNKDLSTLKADMGGVTIQPIFIDGSGNDEFDISNLKYTETRYGLNFNMSTYKDWTNLVLSNEQRFARALQLMVAVKVADLAVNSTRSNRDERISRANAVFELDGNRYNKDYPEHTGLLTKLKSEISRLKQTYNPDVNMKIATLC